MNEYGATVSQKDTFQKTRTTLIDAAISDEIGVLRHELSVIAEALSLKSDDLRRKIHNLSLRTEMQDEVAIDTTYELFDNLDELLQMVALRMFELSASRTAVSPEVFFRELKKVFFPQSHGMNELLIELGLIAHIHKQNAGSDRLISLARARLVELLITYWTIHSNFQQIKGTAPKESLLNHLKTLVNKKLHEKSSQQSFEDTIARSLHAICYVYNRYLMSKRR